MANVQIAMKPWQKNLLTTLAVIVVILTLAWQLVPYSSKWLINRYIAQYDAHLNADDINPDLFPIGLSLSDVTITQGEDTTLSLKELSVGLDFLPLFTGAFHINHILVDGFHTQVSETSDSWQVAGIPLPASDTAPEEEPKTKENAPEEAPAPTFIVRNASIQDIKVQLDRKAGKDQLQVNHLNIAEVSHHLWHWKGNFDLSAGLNNAMANIKGDVDATKDKIDANVDIGSISLSSSDVQHFLPDSLPEINATDITLKGRTSTHYQLAKTPALDFSSPGITLSSKAFSLQQDQQNIRWQAFKTELSNVALSMQGTSQLSASASNKLSLTELALAADNQSAQASSVNVDSQVSLQQNGETFVLDNTRSEISLTSVQATQAEQSLSLESFQLVLDNISSSLNTQLQGGIKGDIKLATAGLQSQVDADKLVNVGSLDIQSPVDIQMTDETLQLSANTTLMLENSSLRSPDVNASLASLALTLSNTSFIQDSDKLHLSTIAQLTNTSGKAQLDHLPDQQPTTNVGYDQLQLTTDFSLDQANNNRQISAQNNTLTLDGFQLSQQDTLSSTLQHLAVANKATQIKLNENGLEGLNAEHNQLSLNNLVASLENGSTLVKWQDINLDSSHIEQTLAGTHAQIESFSITDFLSSQPGQQQHLPALASFDKLTVSDTALQPNGVEIQSIQFDKLNSGVVLSKNRDIENLTLPKTFTAAEPSTEQPSEPKTETPPAPEKQFYSIIHRFSVSSGSKVAFEDRGVSPTLQRTLDIEQLTVDNFNTRDQGEKAHIILKAKNGSYATIDSDVYIEPMADNLTMQANAKIREIELPPISPYVASALGYNIQAGQLNMDLKLTATKGELDGNSHIVLRQFDLGGQQDGGSVLKAGAIPLNLAVGALKDSDNNIVLDLPMKGDINNPSFQWQNFLLLPIRQGLYKASTSYLMQTFVPYANVITVVQFAGEQALKLRVQPLPFNYGEDEPDSTQDVFLEQLTKLMQDRKDAQLKACGVSVAKDIDEEKRYQDLTPEEKQTLLELASQRAENLKAYLVKQDIPSGRIFICSPEIDDNNSAKPHVELTF